MKNGLLLVVLLILFNLHYASGLRINEVELNPNDSCNDCTEWVELYSSEEANLDGYFLKDASNKKMNLSGSFSGYFVITNLSISLNNANEQIFLYSSSSLVDQTPIISDGFNDYRSWQYCSSWKMLNSTKNAENNCENGAPEPVKTNEGVKPLEEVKEPEIEQRTGNNEVIELNNDVVEGHKKVIVLNSGEYVEEEGERGIVVYESKNERIKKYSIYGFCLFLIFIIAVLLLKR